MSQYNELGASQLLRRTADLALGFLSNVAARPVGGRSEQTAFVPAAGHALPEGGEDPSRVIEALVRSADPGLVANNGPRYFGFVTGGSLPVALAADWLTSAWDQNACLQVMSPAAASIEAIAARWVVDLFGLPAETSVGFTTGATMANFTALAAARHAVLARIGWDVGELGLIAAPSLTIVVGEHVHASVLAALQMLGFGRASLRRVAVDDQGRVRIEALRDTLATIPGPVIVCAQAGNVCSGAFDPFDAMADAVVARGGWLHVDGAFGLWATATPTLHHLVAGIARADSWATDAHKWLNVPYDSGFVLVRDAAAHRAATAIGAAYLIEAAPAERDGSTWVPELSRRARGFNVYAALRTLGRSGIRALVERCCTRARQMAGLLGAADGVAILNDVVLNQVLVRFTPDGGGDADAFTRDVIARVQADGTCWLGGTTWNGGAAMRVSVSNWSTSESDIERSAAAIVHCADAARAQWAATAAQERKES